MNKRVSIVSLRAEVGKALAKSQNFVENCKGATNPQVVEMVIASKAEVEVFEAVLQALKGDQVLLKIYSMRGEQ